MEDDSLSLRSNPDPNHNSSGVSAAESSLLVETEADLRVPCYCEENVWRLAHRKLHQHQNHQHDDGSSSYWVVFISNPVNNVPMFHQRAASQDPQGACCWDYHVILIDGTSQEAWVTDMDSRLPYPCSLSDYLVQTFPYEWPYPHAPLFRIVPAATYLRTFASNRSHMFVNHQWNAPPPPYDIIQTAEDVHTLPYLLDFALRSRDETARRLSQEGALGTILTLQQLREHNFDG